MLRAVCFSLLLLLSPVAARAQRIVVAPDLEAMLCSLDIPVGAVRTFYVLATGYPQPAMTGAEFSIDGMPVGSLFDSWTANPSSLVLGHPLARLGGCNIAFAACQTQSTVLLFTVQLFNVSETRQDIVLSVGPRIPPTNPNLACPVVVLCDAPVYTARCADGTRPLVLNPSGTLPAPSDPDPPDGAVGVPTQVLLMWRTSMPLGSCVMGTVYSGVYFGTTPDPPLVRGCTDGAWYDPGPLAPDTTYYWRTVACWAGQTALGPLWRFTTSTLIGVEPATWGRVKSMYR